MFKTLMTTALVVFSVLPVKAQIGPGLGPSDSIAVNQGRYAQVCTSSSGGSLSLRTGPGTNFYRIKTIPNRHTIALVNGQYGNDGFWWWQVYHNGSQGWVRADYVCGDPQ